MKKMLVYKSGDLVLLGEADYRARDFDCVIIGYIPNTKGLKEVLIVKNLEMARHLPGFEPIMVKLA